MGLMLGCQKKVLAGPSQISQYRDILSYIGRRMNNIKVKELKKMEKYCEMHGVMNNNVQF